MAARPHLETRIKAILNPTQSRAPVSRRLAASLLVGASLLSLPFAAIELGPRAATVVQAEEPEETAQIPPATAAPALKEEEPAAPLAKAAPKSPGDDVVEVTGEVVDVQGKPVAGIKVTVTTVTPTTPVVTDSQGKFTLKLSSPEQDGKLFQAWNGPRTRQGLVAFQEKPLPPRVQIILKPARALTAEVTDAAGKAVAEAVVSAASSYQTVAEEKTDAAGRATLLVPADAPLDNIMASKDDVGLDYFLFRQPQELTADPFKVAGDFSGPFKFVLSGIRPMRVRLIDDQGKPLPGIDVYPWYITLPKKAGDGGGVHMERFKVSTDKNGVATFRAIPKGNTSTVNFWTRSKTMIAQERILFDPAGKEDEVTAKLLPAVMLSGQVVLADGKPAIGVLVKAHGKGHQFDGFHAQTKTNAEGRFTLLAHPFQYLTLQATAGKLCSNLNSYKVLDKTPEQEIKLTLKEGTRVFGKVTTGEERRPQAEQEVMVYLGSATEYFKLPKAEQLPNPQGDLREIRTDIAHRTTTNKDGQFEFWVPPGQHTLSGQNQTGTDFKVVDEKELEVNLQATLPATVEIAGRVVLKENPKQGVGGVKIQGLPLQGSGRGLGVVSDSEGRFRAIRGTGAMIVYAVNEDRTLGGSPSWKRMTSRLRFPFRPPSRRGAGSSVATGPANRWPGDKLPGERARKWSLLAARNPAEGPPFPSTDA